MSDTDSENEKGKGVDDKDRGSSESSDDDEFTKEDSATPRDGKQLCKSFSFVVEEQVVLKEIATNGINTDKTYKESLKPL